MSITPDVLVAQPCSADHSCPSDFQFPFTSSSQAISEPLELLGEGNDPRLPDDPLDQIQWPETRELAEKHTKDPFIFGDLDKLEPSISARKKIQVKVGAKSALALVVFQPTLAVN